LFPATRAPAQGGLADLTWSEQQDVFAGIQYPAKRQPVLHLGNILANAPHVRRNRRCPENLQQDIPGNKTLSLEALNFLEAEDSRVPALS
jgi:hypothetical protein